MGYLCRFSILPFMVSHKVELKQQDSGFCNFYIFKNVFILGPGDGGSSLFSANI